MVNKACSVAVHRTVTLCNNSYVIYKSYLHNTYRGSTVLLKWLPQSWYCCASIGMDVCLNRYACVFVLSPVIAQLVKNKCESEDV